ncbi:MAG: hypothetical protein LBH13_10040 [Cellulomonadaceae bacterium]|nr:hypothetical protein [Cellulomonadaceae bacterium]
MTVDTTTIRVAKRTRDILAERAKAQGVSVAQFLADQVAAWERAEWFRLAREGDGDLTPQARAEQDLWMDSDDNWD